MMLVSTITSGRKQRKQSNDKSRAVVAMVRQPPFMLSNFQISRKAFKALLRGLFLFCGLIIGRLVLMGLYGLVLACRYKLTFKVGKLY